MKLVLSIVNHDDAGDVIKALAKNGFSSTRLATTGGFLMAGNVTLLVGVEEHLVEQVIGLIKEYCHSRKQIMPTNSEISYGYFPSAPIEVTVGGATIFVLDVEQVERF
ncbi:MAG: transcriptional regulator [Oscillospiraceae bacterium]|nr:transcriptional regulator [Oscillospiraceae bacterium]